MLQIVVCSYGYKTKATCYQDEDFVNPLAGEAVGEKDYRPKDYKFTTNKAEPDLSAEEVQQLVAMNLVTNFLKKADCWTFLLGDHVLTYLLVLSFLPLTY